MCLEDCGNKKTRREFLRGAGASFGALILAGSSSAQTIAGKKDEKILQEFIEFKNGEDKIDGFLARPKKKGKFPAVVILQGNAALPEDICQTAVKMAENGFVGLAVSSTSREPDVSKMTREFLSSDRYIKRYISDAQARITHLKSKTFSIRAVSAFWDSAARFALVDNSVKAVVALSAAPRFLPSRNSETDPRPALLDFVTEIKSSMQFHFGTNDHLISAKDID